MWADSLTKLMQDDGLRQVLQTNHVNLENPDKPIPPPKVTNEQKEVALLGDLLQKEWTDSALCGSVENQVIRSITSREKFLTKEQQEVGYMSTSETQDFREGEVRSIRRGPRMVLEEPYSFIFRV